MTALTQKIAELRALSEKATAAPWEVTKYTILGKKRGVLGIVGWTANNIKTRTEEAANNAAFIAASRTALPQLLLVVEELVKTVEFYADTEKMYDTAHDSGGTVVGYVRGVDPYDSAESDFEKLPGVRTPHHGKRARETLTRAEAHFAERGSDAR